MNELLYFITPDETNPEAIKKLLTKHPEIHFISLLGIDLGGNGTDEKIPIKNFLEDIEGFLDKGVQTDGSSVILHEIATLNNARVDIVPDSSVNWFVDYNYYTESNPIGTLRIPSFLIHNNSKVDSRSILSRAEVNFKTTLMELLAQNPKLLNSLDLNSINEIDDIILTAATELEFWVQTPEDKADIEKLSTSQLLKEQYWKRTRGAVRSALEETLAIMGKYGLNPEMGHKEVGGIKSKINENGAFTHVMEQLEIDWKYSFVLQAADNELLVREIVGDTFRRYGLEVTFAAKPIPGVAGSGEHTHVGVVARLKNGSVVNLFSPKDMNHQYLSEIGYGALMGFLRNYEVINPFATSSNDALNRLKPGFEAPVCIVAALGETPAVPSRNRSVLAGLVRDIENPLATRFEIRSPNPRSNTYLLLAGIYQVMLDGIAYAISSGKDIQMLHNEITKKSGIESSYLDTNREYISEENVFEYYTNAKRNEIFGTPPETIWENISTLNSNGAKLEILFKGNVFTPHIIEAYSAAVIEQWCAELDGRIIPENIETVRRVTKLHDGQSIKDIDTIMWEKINNLRYYLMKDSLNRKSLFTLLHDSIKQKDYESCSYLQIEMNEKMDKLKELYNQYKRNLFEI